MICNRYVLLTTISAVVTLLVLAQPSNLLCDNTDPKLTAWKISDGVTTMRYYTDINDEATCEPTIVDSGVEANVQAVYYNSDYIWVEATGCPDYLTGPYNGDGNPSFPDNQMRTIVLPRNPTPADEPEINDHTFLGSIGFLLNGVAIYGSGDGMSYNNQQSWWRNAGVAENEGFGCDRSHPARTDLHHHQNPIPFNYNGTEGQSDVCQCFPSDAFYSPNPSEHSPLIGFAIDGYPIYGPYGYANSDGSGGITNITTSYQLRNITSRMTYADGSTPGNPGPDVSAEWPLGIFYEDFEYIENSGLLDYYNGRFAVTPEYPCGTYAYYATMDDEGNSEFPYFIGLAFYGDISPCHATMGLPGDGMPGGGNPPSCDQVPPGRPCCGDGICGGPENMENCPDDCGGLRVGPDVECVTPEDGAAFFFAGTGEISACNSTVDAGADTQLDSSTGLAELNGTGDTGTGTSYTYSWCTIDGSIISENPYSRSITVDRAGTYIYTVTDENGYIVYDRIAVTGEEADPTCTPPQTGTINCEDEPEVFEVVANIIPTNDSGMSGTITFTEVDGEVTMLAELANVSPPGDHAIHIHAIGNCSATDGTSAGGHWNPTDEAHGTWGVPPFHRGDIGNIFIEDDGTGTISRTTDLWCIGCGDPIKDILGKAIIIHEGPDDFSSQPSGAAGPRIGCAEIGDCVPILWYEDADGDGLGNPDVSTMACEQPTGYVSDNTDTDDSNSEITEVVANIVATNDSGMSGTITFTEVDGEVTMLAELANVSPPGDHAIHIHAIGNCSAPNGTSAGGHWNPTDEAHGTWGVPPFHRGDIGNIFIEDDGTGTISRTTDLWCIGCGDSEKDILGKAIIIHEGPDDFSSQPSGAAGPRIGCAEIGDCVPIEWYEDADGDGLGNPDVSQSACEQPEGYVSNSDDDDDGGRPPGGGNPIDCNDPGAGPRCCGDGICDGPETEENCPADCGQAPCEGTLDQCGVCDGPGASTWYEDADGDGHGNPEVSQQACEQPTGYVADNTDMDDTTANRTILAVDESLFLTDGSNFTITLVDCMLSNGSSSTCYQIVTNGMPTDHEMGPWCPDNIADSAEAGGIWLEGGEVYDVDGAFIENMATFYNDDTWLMYDTNGDIYTTETQEDCANAANPNVGAEYENYCVECLPSYVTDLSQTYLIPATPVMLANPANFGGMGPPGMGGNAPSVRGLAFNGVRFDAPAPTNAILGAYTLAPFDDAGGHINLNAGYHYHAATGLSTQIAQNDGHAAMIGYAMDGHAIYERLDANGNEPTDLDECRGHYDDVRGYHYHVDQAGNNNFINCLHGAYAN